MADRRGPVLVVLTALLAVVDGALAAIGRLVWTAHRDGDLTGSEAATFTLLGVSAAIGAVILLVAAVALARRERGHPLARVAAAAAWLCLAGVVVALVAIAATVGVDGVAGELETFGAIVAVLDAACTVYVTGIARRRTRHG